MRSERFYKSICIEMVDCCDFWLRRNGRMKPIMSIEWIFCVTQTTAKFMTQSKRAVSMLSPLQRESKVQALPTQSTVPAMRATSNRQLHFSPLTECHYSYDCYGAEKQNNIDSLFNVYKFTVQPHLVANASQTRVMRGNFLL